MVLQLDEAGGDFGDFDGDVFEIFLGAAEAAVADVFVDHFGLNTVSQLVSDEGVAEVVDAGFFDASFSEVAVDGGSDVTD